MPPPDLAPDDASILGGLRQGDDRAFEQWYLRDYALIWKFALRFTQSRDAAEDLAQDVFAAVWERRRRLDIQGALRTYLLAAVRNRALNVRRHQAMEPPSLGVRASNEMPADQAIEVAERDRALSQAITGLPERQRSALILRLEQDLPNKEIATILGVGEPAVSRLLSRAIESLRATLSPDNMEGM